jgi:hypothetical protein
VINEPASFEAADDEYRDLILKVLEEHFTVDRYERPDSGYWVDAVLQPKNRA